MKEGREWGELGNRERERERGRRDEIETTTTSLEILFSEWENDWERGEERK